MKDWVIRAGSNQIKMQGQIASIWRETEYKMQISVYLACNAPSPAYSAFKHVKNNV